MKILPSTRAAVRVAAFVCVSPGKPVLGACAMAPVRDKRMAVAGTALLRAGMERQRAHRTRADGDAAADLARRCQTDRSAANDR